MTSRFVITHHAVERFLERHGGIDAPDLSQARRALMAELESGVPFGGQVGNGALYLLPCSLVAAVVVHDGYCFVKTVLTREQAIASMESQGATLRPVLKLVQAVSDSPGRSIHVTVKQKAELRALAERHFKAGVGRKQRNEMLRDRGFDPVGTAGEIYRAAYRALFDAMWARKREEYWRLHRALKT